MSTHLASLPAGVRLYAIGDIHGRLDLLERLLEKVRVDAASAEYRLIFLGDYIDRGVYSKQVLDKLLELTQSETLESVFLMGNHEQVMRDIIAHDDGDLVHEWLRFGGRETLMSYGLPMLKLNRPDSAYILAFMAERVPPSHVDFLNNLALFVEFGDYFFCHAGVRPGVPLDRQKETDLLWIRHDFLFHTGWHGKMVVHGHTINTTAEILPNRINLDTGAYATGCLTALGLEADRQWLIQTA